MNEHMKPLTREETKETLTFFFPKERSESTPPEVTVMVRRTAEGTWRAGMSVCSVDDMFEKKEGRLRAFGRLQRRPLQDCNPRFLGSQLVRRCVVINTDTQLHRGDGEDPVGHKALEELGSEGFAKRLRAMQVHPLNLCAEVEVTQ
jgi:hypothetical protein